MPRLRASSSTSGASSSSTLPQAGWVRARAVMTAGRDRALGMVMVVVVRSVVRLGAVCRVGLGEGAAGRAPVGRHGGDVLRSRGPRVMLRLVRKGLSGGRSTKGTATDVRPCPSSLRGPGLSFLGVVDVVEGAVP